MVPDSLVEQGLINQAKALEWVNRHGADVTEFFQDLGIHVTYELKDVLIWLGY